MQRLHGGGTWGVLTGATCAVAVALSGYAERSEPIETIGVAYDASPESECALVAARGLAAHHGATLRAATAVWPTSALPRLARRVPQAGAWWAMMLDAYEGEASGSAARAHRRLRDACWPGAPARELLAFGDGVGVLVVGSRGHGPLRRLRLGSTSAHLARWARCPLLVLPGAGARAYDS